MLVVADCGPLRYLVVLRQQVLLPQIFGEVWIPVTVFDELVDTSAPAIVRNFVSAPPEWLKIVDLDAQAIAEISDEIDLGERAALALALKLNADLVLIDDAAGRREAEAHGLRITGTLGVFAVGGGT